MLERAWRTRPAPDDQQGATTMADLIIISYTDEAKAEAAYAEVQQLQQDLVVQLSGLALVHTADGRVRVESPGSSTTVGSATAGGALFGTIVGLLFFVPFIGFVVGGALGALVSALERTGMNRAFRERVRGVVSEGRSAVVVYATKITADKFAEAIGPFGGEIVQTSLSDEDEALLAHDLVSA
jgi:uncharacterized membrane protein